MHLKTRRLQAFTRATFNDNSIVICVKSTTETGRVTNTQRTQPRLKAVVTQFLNFRSWVILLVFIFVCWQCSFHHIKVHSQSRAHLKVWVILSALKNDCLVNWDKLEHNWFPVFIIDTRWLAELIPCLLLYKLIVTHCCPELCPNTNSLAQLYGAVIVLLGSMLE